MEKKSKRYGIKEHLSGGMGMKGGEVSGLNYRSDKLGRIIVHNPNVKSY